MPIQNFKPTKTTLFFAVIIIILLAKDVIGTRVNMSTPESAVMVGNQGVALSKTRSFGAADSMIAPNPYPQTPISTSPDRMVVHNTDLSLQVKSVADVVKSISTSVTSSGGFVIDSSVTRPGETANGNVSFRIPNDKFEAVLNDIKRLAIKVVSETVSGYDVTDQYEDVDARLATLNATKAKLEKMHTDAATVSELLQVQQELSNLQAQIDNLKGHQKYLAEVSKLTRVTIYLATDDLALPYAPDTSWRPEVVFKNAVRSLVLNFRSIGSALIWAGVYSPFWGAALLGLIIWKKRQHSSIT